MTEQTEQNFQESWQEWQKVLLTLHDDSFFALAENYLGELQSPFHKPRIVKDLFDFLGRGEVRTRLKSLLDDKDLQVLSAVSLLGKPYMEELLDFLGLGSGSLEVHHHLLNLEERLLLYRIREKGRVKMVLTPLWMDPEWKSLLDPRLLFPSQPCSPGTKPSAPWFSDLFAASLGSLVAEKPHWFNPSGEVKKRHAADVLKRFQGRSVLDMERGLKCLLKLGLLLPGQDYLQLNSSFWEDISRLEPKARLALFWTAGGVDSVETASDWSRHLWRVLEGWPPGRALAREVLERWLGVAVGSTGDPSLHSWIACLEAFGVVQSWEDLLIPCDLSLIDGAQGVKILPTQEFHLAPGMALSVVWPVIQGACLKTWDVVTVFEITKSSVTTALSQGETADSLQKKWEAAQGAPLNRNLVFHLGEWEREFSLLRFHKGVVMTVHPSAAALVEEAPSFRSQVLSVLAPGVYMVRSDGLDAWRAELHRRGLPLAADPAEEGGRAVSWGRPWSFSAWSLDRTPLSWPGGDQGFLKSDRSYLEELKAKVESLDWNEESRQEAMARIHRRLVLDHRQLIKPWGRLEKAEARGLDFSGKVRIVEMALTSGHDLLEIHTRDAEGQPVVSLVIPLSLERTGKDYYLKGETAQSHTSFTGYVGKMSLIKRIRTSLF